MGVGRVVAPGGRFVSAGGQDVTADGTCSCCTAPCSCPTDCSGCPSTITLTVAGTDLDPTFCCSGAFADGSYPLTLGVDCDWLSECPAYICTGSELGPYGVRWQLFCQEADCPSDGLYWTIALEVWTLEFGQCNQEVESYEWALPLVSPNCLCPPTGTPFVSCDGICPDLVLTLS